MRRQKIMALGATLTVASCVLAAVAIAGTIRGSQDADVLTGTGGSDTIVAKKGDDGSTPWRGTMP